MMRRYFVYTVATLLLLSTVACTFPPQPSLTPSAPPPPTSTPVPPTETIAPRPTASSTPSPTGTATPDTPTPIVFPTFRPTATDRPSSFVSYVDGLRIRSAPNTTAPVVYTVNAGQRLAARGIVPVSIDQIWVELSDGNYVALYHADCPDTDAGNNQCGTWGYDD